MKKWLASFVFVCSIGFSECAMAQRHDNDKLPGTKWMRSPATNVKHIALDLRFDWKKKQAYGTARLTLVPLKKTDTVFLDAAMLSIHSVVLQNGTALKFIYTGNADNDALVILLDKKYQPGENIIVEIDYHSNWVNQSDPNAIGGSFGKGLRFFEPTLSTPTKRKQLWAMGEAEGNRYWFPCYDAPDVLRTTEVKATVDKNLVVISNGALKEVKENSDGSRTFYYATDRPYPNHLTTIAVGDYTDVKQVYEGIPFHTFCYPDEKEAAIATTERFTDMAKFFSDITGVKYPYKNYAQVMVQDFPFPGLTGQNTVSIISDNMIDDYRTHADFLYLWDGVEANALASQWYGNMITVQNWDDIWLVKAFANYLEGLYTDHKNGHEEYLMWYHPFEMGNVLGDWSAGIRRPVATKNFATTESFVTGDNYPKYRGSLILRMLRKQIGDTNWWKLIQQFTKQSAFKIVTTKDFQNAVRAVTGTDIDWFFEQWVYKMGHPVLEVSKKYDAKSRKLQLAIKQIQQADTASAYPQNRFFKGKMEIEIDDRIETVWIEAKAVNDFVFAAATAPKLVNVDFESTWIKEMVFKKTLEELLHQFINSKDITARKAAMTELAAAAREEITTSADKEKIQHAFLAMLQGKSYWRLKTAALGQLNGLFTKGIDDTTRAVLVELMKDEKSLVRAAAIGALGQTRDPKYADRYIDCFNDSSDRVIFSAASALGKTKSPKAFDALVKLKDKPSWKNQSLMSALTGLQQSGDERGAAIALNALQDNLSPRWFLGNFWDYPFVAAKTLAAFGKGSEGYPVIVERFKQSMLTGDVNDIFQQVLLIATLGDPRGQEVFDMLKEKYRLDVHTMTAVHQYEAQFKESIKK